MSLNVSAIHNGKAQELQPQSVRALLASLVSASSVFGGTLVMHCLMRLSPKLAVVFSPRQLLFRRSQLPPPPRSALAVLRSLMEWPHHTLSTDLGLEAVMFLHYLRSLCLLCGSLVLWVTPSMACFNAFVSRRPRSTDWLNRLSWTNLPTQDVPKQSQHHSQHCPSEPDG
ncbi:hypothetical protein LTR70_010672, partial [Exophiala xenobiotica]